MSKNTHKAGGFILAVLGITALVVPLYSAAADQGFGDRHGQAFERMDGNGDGAIDLDELYSHRARQFERMDADGDGFVTLSEIEELRERAGGREGRGKRAGRMFSRADRNGDGRLSEDEFLAREERFFARVDTDGDGFITRQELAERRGPRRQ